MGGKQKKDQNKNELFPNDKIKLESEMLLFFIQKFGLKNEENKTENTKSLKDFLLKNKSQTIELSAKIQSISISWCVWTKTRQNLLSGRLWQYDCTQTPGAIEKTLAHRWPDFMLHPFLSIASATLMFCFAQILWNQIQKFKSKYNDKSKLLTTKWYKQPHWSKK